MDVIIALDLISVVLSLFVFGLSHRLKPNFKRLIRPVMLVFYLVGILVLALTMLEITGYLKTDSSPAGMGLHLGILAIVILIVLSLNKLRITQLKRDLEEIRELNKAKTEFLTRTSHELKTPLTPLLMQLQMLEKGNFGNLNKEQLKSLAMIERNIKRLSNLISDILYLSRTSAGKIKLKKKPTNLNKLVSEAIKTMQGKAQKKNIVISLKKEQLPLIECDQDRITEVMVNLIDNAIKFAGKNGKVQIETRKAEKNALVSVKDNGIGISEEQMPKLFTPLTQFADVSTRKYGGTGVGLSICKNLVKLHSGKIWAESKGNGNGATLFFSLPLK